MSKPAARIGDSTVHGGTIVAGQLNVVVGGKPQARISDNHVCPMQTPATPPIPHVGGPILPPGAVNVLVGSLPAARIGDMAICVGPPDTIVSGEMSVLIGTAGATVAQFLMSFMLFLKAKFGRIGLQIPTVQTGLGGEIDAALAYSPTLMEQVLNLQENGYTFEWGEAGKGTYHDGTNKKIVIDSARKGEDPTETLQSVAHEAGHGQYALDGGAPYHNFGTHTRQEYIDANVAENLKDEGNAKLNEFIVRDEIRANGGPAYQSDWRTKDFEAEWSSYQTHGDIDRARTELGQKFGTLHPSTAPEKTYTQYYAKAYEDHWDKHHP